MTGPIDQYTYAVIEAQHAAEIAELKASIRLWREAAQRQADQLKAIAAALEADRDEDLAQVARYYYVRWREVIDRRTADND